MSTYARQVWSLYEPIHSVTYFSPEPLGALKDAGYRGFWMGYFAGRAAPLGAVGPEPVESSFYNFSHERVAQAVPAAWEFAPPETALDARLRGSVAALRRCWGPMDPGNVPDLLARAAASPSTEGLPLFAANLALPWPSDPIERIWHAATLLREHRGDAHVNALRAAGISGRESHVFHAIAEGLPREMYRIARDFEDDEWAAVVEALTSRGLISDGSLTPDGQVLKDRIEEETDEVSAKAFGVLNDQEQAELYDLLRPLAKAVVASGDLPLDTPIGLDLRRI